MTTTKDLPSLEKLRRELRSTPEFCGVDSSLAAVLGGHGQTLLGHFLPTHDLRHFAPQRVELSVPDGDRLVGFMSNPETQRIRGLLHIFHGLAGSSESNYMPRAARSALHLGFAVVLWNHRGCGPGRNLALQPYHSGRSDDLARAVKWGRDRFETEEIVHGVLGYSLSANATCLLAARVVPTLDTNPLPTKVIENSLPGALPDFALAINPPFNLRAASERLSRGPARIYGQSFMPAMLESLDDRANWSPENEQRALFRGLAIRARKNLNIFNNVAAFDEAYTGPAGGFVDHVDYYDRASAGRYLVHTSLPLVILSADDDPITHGFADLEAATIGAVERHPMILLDRQICGGHMGFVDRRTLTSLWKKHPRWLEKRIELYLKAFLPVTPTVKGSA